MPRGRPRKIVTEGQVQATETPVAHSGVATIETVPATDTTERGFSETRKYWMGVVPGAPFHSRVVAGFDFPEETKEVIDEKEGDRSIVRRLSDSGKPGVIRDLEEADIRRIAGSIKNLYVTTVGARPGVVYDRRDNRQRAQRTDRPLSDFLFCVPLDSIGSAQFATG